MAEENQKQPLFGADRIPLNNIEDLQRDAPEIIVWAAPIMFIFVILEMIISHRQNRALYDRRETVGSVLVGLGNVTINFAIKAFVLTASVFVYNLIPWRIDFRWWTFIPCYILFDLCSYWAHQISHRSRFFWATHVVHHSGEHYNLSVSFRLSWIQYLKVIFMLPVVFAGFHPIIIFVTNQIAVLFQFWVHTEYIRKLHPVVEYIFATPSNHRVHHGSQEIYRNKNYGATFIFWDRIFKTYEPEHEHPVYGITHNITHKHNPLHINFHELKDLIQDARTAKGWRLKLFYIFGDPEKIARHKQQSKPVPAKSTVFSAQDYT